MIILSIINFLLGYPLGLFLGYLAGRWGDYYLNFWLKDPPWAPHHWIYGFLLIIMGPIILKNSLGLWILSFGIGLFVSDLKDFLKLKILGPDGKTRENRKFWHIN